MVGYYLPTTYYLPNPRNRRASRRTRRTRFEPGVRPMTNSHYVLISLRAVPYNRITAKIRHICIGRIRFLTRTTMSVDEQLRLQKSLALLKRRRACDSCRQKKRRCGGGNRCSYCVNRNLLCTYFQPAVSSRRMSIAHPQEDGSRGSIHCGVHRPDWHALLMQWYSIPTQCSIDEPNTKGNPAEGYRTPRPPFSIPPIPRDSIVVQIPAPANLFHASYPIVHATYVSNEPESRGALDRLSKLSHDPTYTTYSGHWLNPSVDSPIIPPVFGGDEPIYSATLHQSDNRRIEKQNGIIDRQEVRMVDYQYTTCVVEFWPMPLTYVPIRWNMGRVDATYRHFGLAKVVMHRSRRKRNHGYKLEQINLDEKELQRIK
ncbi:hypothetical protein DFH07DRAFT_934950 [Mycena maculata]|uniref:Zn(2)-C6 fungal-type domain-containing protein n=1 Tax=Mycena maculata TaxID=230809 RepID=A0AAD7P2C3_9AGAR|nr:hypothetical protein DFH07DRAFT_934950 [Mycena maculata]